MFIKAFYHAIALACFITSSLNSIDAPFYKFVFGPNAPIQRIKGLTEEASSMLHESFAQCLRWHRATAIGCREPRSF